MVPLSEARRRIDAAEFREWPTRGCGLADAVGRFAAEEIRAPRDEPVRAVAAMDGFAVRAGAREYRLREGACRPGEPRIRLDAGAAISIATGAPLPAGADSVLRLEWAHVSNHRVAARRAVRVGQDVHAPGEDFRRGTQLVARGERLRAYHLGPLAALGLDRVRVYDPTITLLAVGDEIAGSRGVGVRDSITPALGPLLAFGRIRRGIGVPDRLAALRSAIRLGAARSDLVVTVGGTSVGPHDLTKSGVAEVGRVLFDGVRINVLKRGAVGEVDGVPVVMLPGQIGAALVTWHEHGLHVVSRLVGREARRWERVVLAGEVRNPHRMDSVYLFDVKAGRATVRPWGVHNAAEFLRSNAFGIVPRGRCLRRARALTVQRLEG